MKSTFIGYYSTPKDSIKDIWISDSTLFVFDTNCLLNLYRCEDHTRKDILGVMREIAPRVWIPFQVGFEYQRNRRIVIEESIDSLNKIKNELQKIHIQNILNSGNVKKHLYNSLSDEILELQKTLKAPIEDYIEKNVLPRINNKEEISKHDFIRDELDIIVGNNIGKIPSQEQINAINELGNGRYPKQQPPGFNDAAKKDISYFSGIEFQNKYGDLYLWMELINKAKDPEIKNIIFICDDNKNDWWYKLSGKTHGALESLKTEIIRESAIDNFMLINQLTFLNEAKKYLNNISVSDSSLKEVQELSLNQPIESYVKTSDTNYETTPIYSALENSVTVNSNQSSQPYNFKKYFEAVHGTRNALTSASLLLSSYQRILSEIESGRNHLKRLIDDEYYSQCKEFYNKSSLNFTTISERVNSLMNEISIRDIAKVAMLEQLFVEAELLNEELKENITPLRNYLSLF